MNTILIPITQGVEAKNILRTDIFKLLKDNTNIKIVLLFSTIEKADYYKNEFLGGNVVCEVLDTYKNNFINIFFSRLKFNLINTKTLDIKRKMKLDEDRNYPLYYYKFIFNRIFARRIFRKIIRWLDYKLTKDDNYKYYFNKYKPDLVILAHLFGDYEISILRQAKKYKIKSIGLINSWDKLTARSMIRLLPDKMLVHNKLIKQDAIKYADMKDSDIEIIGIPHYDYYVNRKRSTRDKFFEKLGVNPEKKLIVYCPPGRAFSNIDQDIILLIYTMINNSLRYFNIQLLVRYPPNDFVDLDSKLKDLNIIFEKPGKRFSVKRGVDWDMNQPELDHLANLLYHCDLMICYSSSMSIDAAIFNKPIINIDFEINKQNLLVKSPRQYYYMDHYVNILKTRGIKMVKNKKELEYWIKEYLANPLMDSKGREIITKQQIWQLDGESGKRTVDFILKYLYE